MDDFRYAVAVPELSRCASAVARHRAALRRGAAAASEALTPNELIAKKASHGRPSLICAGFNDVLPPALE